METSKILELAKAQEPKLQEYRNYLHENPELANQEYNTSRFIREKLISFGLTPLEGFSGTSVVADLDTGIPGPAILMRADIDALPIQEAVEWGHKSRTPGVMHACGHDVHTANLLSLAEILTSQPGMIPKGRIRFCFQAAEEKLPGGAKKLAEEGVCEGMDMAFGMHCGGTERGSIRCIHGNASMNIGTYDVHVIGKGGHTGYPFRSNDPIAALGDIALGIQRLVAAKMAPDRTNTVSVSYISGGSPAFPNVIPEDGHLGGTIRCLYPEDRKLAFDEIRNITEHICAMRGCCFELEENYGYPGMVHDETCMDYIQKAAEKLGIRVEIGAASPGGEDFSYYEMKVPGAYFYLGLNDASKPEVNVRNHNPHFYPDPEGFVLGLELFLALITELLGE